MPARPGDGRPDVPGAPWVVCWVTGAPIDQVRLGRSVGGGRVDTVGLLCEHDGMASPDDAPVNRAVGRDE